MTLNMTGSGAADTILDVESSWDRGFNSHREIPRVQFIPPFFYFLLEMCFPFIH